MTMTVLQLQRRSPTESLCHSVTSPFEKGGLFIGGSAAVGILMTLHKKREIVSTVGPFLGEVSELIL